MTQQITEPDPTNEPDPAEQDPTTPDPEAPAPEPEPDEEQEETPPEVLRANLTKANQEAARYRTRLREVEAALAARKTDEEVQALLDNLTTERETAERSLLIENVALKFNLPPELAARLAGSTREELEADAQALAKFVPTGDDVPPGDLDGGLTPGNSSTDDGLSPRERVRKIKGYR